MTFNNMADRYQKQRKIGEGGEAKVYRALDTKTGEIVAMKEIKLDTKDLGTLLNEVKYLKILSASPKCHPFIVCLKDYFMTYTTLNIITEYFGDGYTLEDVYNHNAVDHHDLKILLKHLFEAVVFIHANGIAHGDLKLENILFSSGNIKIIDFGYSCSSNKCGIHGTQIFFPPERWWRKNVNPQSSPSLEEYKKGDVWTLGLIGYLLWVGNEPDIIDQASDLMEEELDKSPDERKFIWSEFIKPEKIRDHRMRMIIELSLTPDPEERPTSARILDLFSVKKDYIDNYFSDS